MGVTAALIIGGVAAAGVGAYSSSQAGAASKEAAGTAAKGYQKAAGQGISVLDEATKRALAVLEPYRTALSDPANLQRQALGANITSFGQSANLAKRVNTFNQSEIDRLLGGSLPGYKEGIQQAQNNTLSMLRGELPADVAASITRGAAQRSLQGGFSGSASAGALTSRDLGLTSLDLMNQGSNSLQRWIQTSRAYTTAQPFDPTSMFITPQFVANTTAAGAGIAGQQANLIYGSGAKTADLLTGGSKSAVDAALAGDIASSKAQQQGYASIQNGINGATSAVASMYTPNTAGYGQGSTYTGAGTTSTTGAKYF